MSEYIVRGAKPNETVLHTQSPNGYESWQWLPVREEVVRCKDCATFIRDATPHDDDRPHFCSELGLDLADGDGFCAWGRRTDA